MNNRQDDNKEQNTSGNTPKPDQETLHTTDPQENMEGPVSSAMHKTGEAFDTSETKEQADRKKDENM